MVSISVIIITCLVILVLVILLILKCPKKYISNKESFTPELNKTIITPELNKDKDDKNESCDGFCSNF
jgi:uncharacterized membrane protein affecting hemolysin expression